MRHNYQPLRVSLEDDDNIPDMMLEQPSLDNEIRSLRRSRIAANITLGVACLLAVVNVYLLYKGHMHRPRLEDGLYPRLVPPMSLETKVFEQELIYAAPPSPESDAAWNNLLPPGRGFIVANDGERHGLEPGQPTDAGSLYSVAVFHQLHCLGMLRGIYWRLLEGAATDDPTVRAFAIQRGQDNHAQHCWDYIRQSLQCSADLSLEWPRLGAHGERKNVDGWGIPHLCKKWDDVMQYMDAKHFNGSKRTDINGE